LLDWNDQPPGGLLDAWRRIARLVHSIQDVKVIENVSLTNAAEGQLIAHHAKRAPRSVLYVLTGDAASTAIVTLGVIDATHVRMYASANCTVDLLVVL
jgi:hypothetical protein